MRTYRITSAFLLGFFFISLQMFLVGCGKDTTLSYLTLSGSDSCDPPCWNGITPGITTEGIVFASLAELQEQDDIKEYSAISPDYYHIEVDSQATVNIRLKDERVFQISILFPPSSLRVRDVIDVFGIPEAYVSNYSFDDESQPCSEWVENDAYGGPNPQTILAYPSQGVSFTVMIEPDFLGSVCPWMWIEGVTYYAPLTQVEALLQQDQIPAFGLSSVEEEDVGPWHGYGPGYARNN